ncbi:EscU/YscU/HrcU family type III secretion system export apparatus switch protein [Paenibacillus sp. P26]|nr:EscU/YscU/HrcU family type III secretion system export apparatus switch protein [Paenibacillus sp. P26]
MKEKPLRLKKAVALMYAPESAAAPKVVAKGQGRVAEAIMDKAKEHGVPVQGRRLPGGGFIQARSGSGDSS